ncbi:MAG TPA: S24 family peptidase [Thermoanaerobaculia bacterium]|jgi:hypothetical protein
MTALDAADVIADLLARGHSVRFRAGGDSMDPIIHGQDVLHVEPLRGEPLRRGEVVLVLAERGLTAHRIVRIDNAVVITRGDNAPADDPPVAPSRILGRVVSAEHRGREVRVRRLRGLALQATRLALRARRYFSAFSLSV